MSRLTLFGADGLRYARDALAVRIQKRARHVQRINERVNGECPQRGHRVLVLGGAEEELIAGADLHHDPRKLAVETLHAAGPNGVVADVAGHLHHRAPRELADQPAGAARRIWSKG